MAFFDKISKSVTEAGQKTIAKTKELADLSRLNAMIAEEEKIITNQYYQIGKLYVSIHKNDFETDFSGMVAAINESEARIGDYKKQILNIKGVQRCGKCGAEVPSGVAFCSSCGSAMPKIEAFDTVNYEKCIHCGTVIKKGMRFCTACGKSIVTSTPVADTSAELPASNVCTECGTAIKADTQFCTVCGKKVKDEEVIVSVPVEVTKRFCTQCGATLEPDVVFCTECGIKL